MYELTATKEKPTVASGGLGDTELGGSIVDSYYKRSPRVCQAQIFDHALSLALDNAQAQADAAHLAACDHFVAMRHHAFEAASHAAKRDEALAEVIRLESMTPDMEGDR